MTQTLIIRTKSVLLLGMFNKTLIFYSEYKPEIMAGISFMVISWPLKVKWCNLNSMISNVCLLKMVLVVQICKLYMSHRLYYHYISFIKWLTFTVLILTMIITWMNEHTAVSLVSQNGWSLNKTSGQMWIVVLVAQSQILWVPMATRSRSANSDGGWSCDFAWSCFPPWQPDITHGVFL